jgi:serine/threonine-protein kinase
MDTKSLAAIAIMGVVAVAGLYFVSAAQERRNDDLRQQVAELRKELDAARQAAADAGKIGKQEREARLALEKAREAEDEARRRGELAVQQERARREEEARRTADAARAAEKTSPLAAGSTAGGYDEALALEAAGRGAEAVKVYARAARNGNGKAAMRLGEIYDKGLADVPRDHAESLKWYNLARVLGEAAPLGKPR